MTNYQSRGFIDVYYKRSVDMLCETVGIRTLGLFRSNSAMAWVSSLDEPYSHACDITYRWR